MVTPFALLRATLAVIAIVHVVLGAGMMLSESAQRFLIALYGVAGPWSVRDVYFTRVLGSFAVVVGTVAAAAARDPRRYRLVAWCLVEFFVLRDLHRHLFQGELVAAFGVTPATNVLTSVVV